MRIAIFGYAHPFGEGLYYGAEREIWYLIQELKNRGHDITVFSVKGCNLPGVKFIEMERPWDDAEDIFWKALHQEEAAVQKPFDIIHSYMASGNINLQMRNERKFCLEPFFGFSRWTNNIIAYSNKLNDVNGGYGTRIYFGVPEEEYNTYYPKLDDEYLVWIGRLDIGKAPHIAIEVAKRAGKKLVIMGQSYHYPYFIDKVFPHIDEKQIFWLRCCPDHVKKRVLRGATAFLSTNWSDFHEMLGIVNIESLACGTPVIGWAHAKQTSAINHKGGEIIEHGEQGFIIQYDDYSLQEEEESVALAVGLIKQIGEIDRKKCYDRFLERFTAREMADHHLNYYHKVIERGTVLNITNEI